MSLFDTGIRPAIDLYLLDEAAKTRDYGDYWSASSAGYCMRKVIFDRLKVPHVQPDDPRKQRVFTAGHIFHEWMQRITKDAGLSIASEVELQDEDLMVRGHFDDLVLITKKGSDILAEALLKGYGENEPDGRIDLDEPDDEQHLILYDYKTQNSRAFSYQKDRAVSYFHKMQVATYMYMLRQNKVTIVTPQEGLMLEPLIKSLTEARLLYISKDDLRMTEKVVLWDEKLEAEVTTYWKTLNKYWQEKKLPPCTCADHEGGFMAKEKFNPFFYEGEPCSLDWYNKNKPEEKNE